MIVPTPPNAPAALVSIPSVPRRRAGARIAFAAVLVATVGAVAAVRRQSAEPAPVEPPVSGSVIRAGGAAHRAREAPVEAPASRPVRAPKVRPAASIRSGGAERHFTAELELLQRAQIAYTQRDFSTALALLAAHARLFSRGHLAEEREALRVRSLRGAGRTDEAHRGATEFAARFPRSVLLPRVDSAESE
jgi:hypothetical protein